MHKYSWRVVVLMILLAMGTSPLAHAEQKKPNILVIFGDDVGITKISAYSDGIMRYWTPTIKAAATDAST